MLMLPPVTVVRPATVFALSTYALVVPCAFATAWVAPMPASRPAPEPREFEKAVVFDVARSSSVPPGTCTVDDWPMYDAVVGCASAVAVLPATPAPKRPRLPAVIVDESPPLKRLRNVALPASMVLCPTVYAFATASRVAFTFEADTAAKALALKLEPDPLIVGFAVASTSSVPVPASTLA